MLHRGVRVGSLFVAEKEGAQHFSSQDEEVLLLFASQAATAITNARTHREEQKARADVEALVDASPVGVVVLDVRTGRPLSFNPEASRIFEGLRIQDRPLEELLEIMTIRRGDGREFSLAELSVKEALSSAQRVRAEVIMAQVPDGRSVTMLINGTPVRSEDGEVVTYVVTVQDMSPIQERERSRAEFLGMVSHELRVPLTSIKGSAATVRGAPSSMEPAVMLQFFRIIEEQADHMSGLVSDLLDVGRIETGMLSVSPEPIAAATLVDQARTTFLSAGGKNPLEIDLPPDLPWILADRGRVVQVLNNLLSNAARHSSETAPIRVSAVRDGMHVRFSVADNGKGLAPERLPYLFSKYARGGGKRRGARHGRHGAGSGHMQGVGRGPWRPHLGGERSCGRRHPDQLHDSRGRSGGDRRPDGFDRAGSTRTGGAADSCCRR